MSTLKTDKLYSTDRSTGSDENILLNDDGTTNLKGNTTVTGTCTATTFSGSGASLTNLPAANLTGTAAAINGSNITNLPAANLTGALPAISGASLTNLPGGGKILQFVEGTVSNTNNVSSDAKTYINMYNTITPVASDSKLLFILAVGINRESQQKSFSLSVSKDNGSNYYWHSGGTNISWHNQSGTDDDLYWQEGPFMWTEDAGTAGTAETHKVYSDLDQADNNIHFNLYTKGIFNCWEVAA